VKFAETVSDALLTLFYPQICLICGNSVEEIKNGVACQKCWQATRIFTRSDTICFKCGKPSEISNALLQPEKIFCRMCDADFFDIARAVGVYEGALRMSVLNLKERPFIAARLKDLLGDLIENTNFSEASRILPVPLSRKRLAERGFNQATVIARLLAQKTKLPFDEHTLIREKHTAIHRAGMDAIERRKSVEKTFTVKRPRLVEKAKILLVDDVFTTGATVSACAEALKKNGAEKVFVLTIARAV
jgi:ComF family protein